jgi:hypothetical protein
VQDIDTPEDWQRAEWMFKAMQEGAKITVIAEVAN